MKATCPRSSSGPASAGFDGQVRIDESADRLVVGQPHETTFDRRLFQRALNELGDAGEDAAYVLDTLPDPFTAGELDHAWLRSTTNCSPDTRPTEPSNIYDG